MSTVYAFAFLAQIMLAKDYSYAYVYDHVSNEITPWYVFASIWEGQEGSFLLWLLFQSLIGLFVLKQKSTFWISYSFIGLFLNAFVLGWPITESFTLGQSPFLSLKEKYDWSIFILSPNYLPKDGKGLNLLLRNIWMIIHPPVIFLAFALSAIPFSMVIAKLYSRFELSVTLFKRAVLVSILFMTTGIIMGAYWAYETLNFGGYWSWDPVENAIYIPWLLGVCAFHLTFFMHKSKSSFNYAALFTCLFYLSVLYSTFLTRSGILGNSSVHSFTGSSLYGQILTFLLFFCLITLIGLVKNFIKPSLKKTQHAWTDSIVQLLVLVLSCAAFQVTLSTSFPVFNALGNVLGITLNLAAPNDVVSYYSEFQLPFAILSVVLLVAYYVKSTSINQSFLSLSVVAIISIVISYFVSFDRWQYVVGLGIFLFSLFILLRTVLQNKHSLYALTSHIGFVLFLIGVLVSSAKQASLTAQTKFVETEEFVGDNLLIKQNEPQFFQEYGADYLGTHYKYKDAYIPEENLLLANAENTFIVRKPIEGFDLKPGDKIQLLAGNRYYKININNTFNGDKHTIYPRIQSNKDMGIVASPVIVRKPFNDLYIHVTNFPDPSEKHNWSDAEWVSTHNGITSYKQHHRFKFLGKVNTDVLPGYTLKEKETATKYSIQHTHEGHGTSQVFTSYLLTDAEGNEKIMADYSFSSGLKVAARNIDNSNEVEIMVRSCPQDWIVISATHFPWISLVWIGSILCLLGMSMRLLDPVFRFIAPVIINLFENIPPKTWVIDSNHSENNSYANKL